MGRCGCSSGNGGRGSSKRTSPEIGESKPGWSLAGCVSVEYDTTWLSRPERFFNAITPPQIASELSLLRNRFDFYRRAGPIHRARGNRHPLVRGHEVFKGKHHHPLSEEVRIPFDEPNFPCAGRLLLPGRKSATLSRSATEESRLCLRGNARTVPRLSPEKALHSCSRA